MIIPRTTLVRLGALLALILAAWGLYAPQSVRLPLASAEQSVADGRVRSDEDLYRRIAAEVSAGQPYHASAMAIQRANNYPVAPFFTVRPPLLAWMMAALGEKAALALFAALALACVIAWGWRARQELGGGMASRTVPLALAFSFVALASPSIPQFHDAWAGLLITLGLALWSPQRLWPALLCFFMATLFRELALAGLVWMAVAAAWERRWREVGLWMAALGAGAGLLIWHASIVWSLTQAGDPHSQGWDGMGGWAFLLQSMRAMTPLLLLPKAGTALLVPLMTLGWLGWGNARAWRVLGLIAGFGLALMLFARPANFYWALLFAPLLFTGIGLLPLLPAALRDPAR